MKKSLVFDMDGTIANFYGVHGWLEYLEHSNPYPYEVAKPLYNMDILREVLELLKVQGWKIIVTSWLAKNSTPEFKDSTRKAKRKWLEKYGFPYDEIHLVQYGTTKANCTRKNGGFQILVDDNAVVRNGWHLGSTIDANRDIMPELMRIAAGN